jgi:hypothetical protein
VARPEASESHSALRLWLLRAVLFALGFTIPPLLCALYWSAPYAEPSDARWERPVLALVALLGGILSAAFGKRFWDSFVSWL